MKDVFAGKDPAWQAGYNSGLDNAECDGDCGAYSDGYNDGEFDGREAGYALGMEESVDYAEAVSTKVRMAFLSAAEDLQRNLDFGQTVPWAMDGVDPKTAYAVVRELHRISDAILEVHSVPVVPET